MAFVRWNQTTQIWELAATPESPSTPWNHLPIGTPTLPGDTVNKAYVDAAVAGVVIPPNIAFTNIANVFTKDQTITGNLNPSLVIIDTSQTALNRRFNITNFGLHLYLQATDDPPTVEQGAVRISRTGEIKISSRIFERARTLALGEWINWTPTWRSYGSGGANGVIGNGTLWARYTIVGKTVFYVIRIHIGGTTVVPAGYWVFTLPFPNTGYPDMSGAGIVYNGTTGAVNMATLVPGSYFFGIADSVSIISGHSASGTTSQSFVSATWPLNWTVNDTLIINGFYETL